MQAQYEHSPPKSSTSTSAQLSPPSRTRPATFSPGGPPPTTTTSTSVSVSICELTLDLLALRSGFPAAGRRLPARGAARAPRPGCRRGACARSGRRRRRWPRRPRVLRDRRSSRCSRPYATGVGVTRITLDEAVDLTRTGDLWLFRGSSAADQAIRLTTNDPVNHVGTAGPLDDLPPLLWHAELGHSLPDLWTGDRHRGVQLHDLRDAVCVWARRYGQRAWLRQLTSPITPEMEDAVLRTIARLDGTPFPSTARLAGRWLGGRLRRRSVSHAALETAYCAEVVALTYQAMGLLPEGRAANWYDPGRFWSGDDLDLLRGATLAPEIEVLIPPDGAGSSPRG